MAVGLWSACQLRLPFHGSNILAVVRSILTAQGRGSTEVLGGGGWRCPPTEKIFDFEIHPQKMRHRILTSKIPLRIFEEVKRYQV